VLTNGEEVEQEETKGTREKRGTTPYVVDYKAPGNNNLSISA
jgi:hypothetical protein